MPSRLAFLRFGNPKILILFFMNTDEAFNTYNSKPISVLHLFRKLVKALVNVVHFNHHFTSLCLRTGNNCGQNLSSSRDDW